MTTFTVSNRFTGYIMPVGNGSVGKTTVSKVLEMISRGRVIDNEALKKIRKTNNLEFIYVSTRQIFAGQQYSVTLQFLIPPGQKEVEGDSTGRCFEDVISIYRTLIRRLDVVLFTYDLANHDSFHDLAYWVDGVTKLMNDSTHFILLGTHLDQAAYSEISKEEIRVGLEYLRKEFLITRPTWRGKCAPIEISCLSRTNLELLLRYLAGSIISANQIRA